MSAEAVNNAAGYGFSGMDEHGTPSWELICNVNILGIEVPSSRNHTSVKHLFLFGIRAHCHHLLIWFQTATSFKTFIDNWNIQTGIWLKA